MDEKVISKIKEMTASYLVGCNLFASTKIKINSTRIDELADAIYKNLSVDSDDEFYDVLTSAAICNEIGTGNLNFSEVLNIVYIDTGIQDSNTILAIASGLIYKMLKQDNIKIDFEYVKKEYGIDEYCNITNSSLEDKIIHVIRNNEKPKFYLVISNTLEGLNISSQVRTSLAINN